MNLLSGIAAAGRFVGEKVKQGAKAAIQVVRDEFGEQLRRPVQDTVAVVRSAVSEGFDRARDAAADAIAKGSAGAGVRVAERVASEGHWTRRVSPLLDLPPQVRTVVIWSLVALAAFLIFQLGRKH